MRALMVPSGVGRAHLTRLVLVARALRERGAEVAFAFSEDEPLLTWEDVEVFAVPEVVVEDFDRNVFGAYTTDLVEACIDAEIRAIEAFRPDVIVSDLRPSAAITAAVVGVPHATVVNAYLARQFDPALVFGSARSAGAAAVVGRGVQRLQKRTAVGAFRQVAAKRGARHLRTLDDLLEGDRTLLADLWEFCPLRDLPSTTVYVGPLVWEGAPRPPRDPVDLPGGARPLVYATTGTTGSRQLVNLVVQAFADEVAVDVVVTTGAYLDVSDVSPPPHIRLERFVPGSAVLGRAMAAVHCGGNGTTYQVIASGRPAVVVPFTNDQRLNARLVTRRHLGIALDPDRTSPAQLRTAVAMVVRDRATRESLKQCRDLVAAADGPGVAAAEILHVAAVGGDRPH